MTDETGTSATARAAFLAAAGWSAAEARPLAGDASTRSYERLSLDGRRAVLMIAPPAAEAAACPPDASPEERIALGYNARARLAGPNLHAFTEIAAALTGAGLSAPEIYAADAAAGFALLEDLGDDLFARIAPAGNETALYAAAIDALARLRAAAPAPPRTERYAMLDYDATALAAETELLLDWYWPLKNGAPPNDDLRAEHAGLWAPLFQSLSAPSVYALRDYHAENLLWLPERGPVRNVGLLDFQDALFGQPAYDLVSLLEDARRDVAPALAEEMMVRYLTIAGEDDRDQFFFDYATLAAQRNAKILGIFARLAKRDGKTRYLSLLPRVEAHFRTDLQRPELEDLHGFYRRWLPELAL